MEAVGLGVGVVALASLFDTALDCFKHVKVAKSFGSDYQTYVLRLQCLRLRFSRWGEAAGLSGNGAASIETQLTRSDKKLAAALIGRIIEVFNDAARIGQKYSGKSSDLVGLDEDAARLGDVGKLCQKMRDICLRRQRATSVMKKTTWALYSKDKFLELIDNVQAHVDDLVGLFSAITGRDERSLCVQEARELSGENEILTLHSVARAQDTQLAEAIAKLPRLHVAGSMFNNYNSKIVNQAHRQIIRGNQNISI